MRLTCPYCGERDSGELTYGGAAVGLKRPAADAPIEAWDDYVHNRDNPAGVTQDLWYHEFGCGAWLLVTRDTVTHRVFKVELASAAQETGS